MLSLTRTLLALAAFTTLTTAAPSSPSPATSPPAALTKRADYHPVDALGLADYCNEAVPRYTYGPNAPLVTDCQAIPVANPGLGYWAVSGAEQTAKGAERWVRLAASGTCAFEVRMDPEATDVAGDFRFGTNDLGFYIRSHAGQGDAQDGRLEVRAGVWCHTTRAAGGKMVEVNWRVVHA
jgi:hypothetical protein